MRSIGVVALAFLLSPFAGGQTSDANHDGVSPSSPSTPQVQPPAAQAPQQPSYANYSIMLVNPAGGTGGAVVLMHNPKNELEFVNVNNTKQALSAGYVAVRAVELGEFIAALKEENALLATENTQLRIDAAKQVPVTQAPSQTEIEAQQRAQMEAEKATRRRQMIQTWLLLQNMNRPQTQNLNVTVSDCTRYPALCAAK